VASLYGAWPVWKRPPVEYDVIVSTFVEVSTSVPLRASSEKGDGWREWADGGFAAHLLLSRKLSRKTYVSALEGLLELVVRIQQKYPDLYAVLKVSHAHRSGLASQGARGAAAAPFMLCLAF
jgi:hypothetical protein